MRRLPRIVLGLTTCLVFLAACGSATTHVWVTAPSANSDHRPVAALGSPYRAELHWDAISLPSQKGYHVYVNGKQDASVGASPYVFADLSCGSTYTLGVRAYDARGQTSALFSANYRTSPCAGLRLGVSLQQIDGGPTYFADHEFTNSSATFDNHGFYPIGVAAQTLGCDVNDHCANWDSTMIAAYQSVGVNGFIALYNGYGQGVENVLASDGFWQIDRPQPSKPLAPTYRNAIQGYSWFDEIDSNSSCGSSMLPTADLGETVSCGSDHPGGASPGAIAEVTQDLHGAHGAGDRTRFVYGNYTGQDVANAPCCGLATADAKMFASGLDVVAYDYYAINGLYCCRLPQGAPWYQYDVMEKMRALTGDSRPVWFGAEAGNPFPTGNGWNGTTATPAAEMAEVWNGIIGGARGFYWFDHDFGTGGGWAECDDDLINGDGIDDERSCGGGTLYQTLQSDAKQLNSEITKKFAPIVNDPFANGYVTNTSVTGSGNSMNEMVKYDAASHDFYLFAAPRFNHGQTVTYQTAGDYTGPVTVYAPVSSGLAPSTVTARDGRFSDRVGDGTSVRIYVIRGDNGR
jgi:hypothetical protein